MTKLPPQLSALNDAIHALGKAHGFTQAKAVVDAVNALLGIDSDTSWKAFTDSQGKIRSNAGWFMEAEGFADRRAVYKIADSGTSNLDLKAYWTHKTKKSVISWLVALTPNFEDEPFYQTQNIGIDFIIPEKADRVIVALSKNYVIRTMELQGQLSVTQQEIFDKWLTGFDFSNKAQVHELLWQSFDVEPLNERFYKEISSLFIELEQHLATTKLFDERHAAYFANRLIGRIIFCWFLDKKGLINPEAAYFETSGMNATDYYHEKLETLFFKVFNKPQEEREKNVERITPYLNGGLFEAKDGDKFGNPNVTFPADYFDRLIGLLRHYNFTTDESTSTFQQVAIDPEMLGRIFENLLAEQVEETGEQARKAKGAFYTPREIVDYMCRESLREYLKSKLPELEDRDQRIGQLLDSREHEWRDQQRNFRQDLKPYKHDILKALEDLRVIDPACGSGAFPMGMLHLLLQIYERLDDFDPYKKKLSIIRENLYGVDIEPMAVEISRLRAWLSIIVDEEKVEPLPNLDFKFVCANSLIPLEMKAQTNLYDQIGLDDDIQEIRNEYYSTNDPKDKTTLRNKFEDLIEIGAQQGIFTSKREKQLRSYHPFDAENIAGFFDSKFMFGISAFDIVIANPPYVGEKGHKEMFRSIAKEGFGKFYQGKMDLFYFFFHLALEIGKEKSQNAFITTNYYITAHGARKLCADLKERSTILKLINFNELRIFKSALGQHNMITIFTKMHSVNTEASTCMSHRKGTATPIILNSILNGSDKETEYYRVKQSQLYDGSNSYIRIRGVGMANDPLELIFEKMLDSSELLDDICNINQGIVSGADKFTRKHLKSYSSIKAKVGEGIFVLKKSEIDLLELLETERNIIHPFYKNSQINKYYIKPNDNLFILYIDKNTNFDRPSSIMKHLTRFKPLLSKKRECINGRLPWYALHWSRDIRILEDLKIVNSRRSKRNAFALETLRRYEQSDIMITTLKEEKKKFYDIKYILALLNSKLYYFWLYYKGKRKGEMLELYYQPLSEIPVKKISPKQQGHLISIVDQILTITSAKIYDPRNPPTEQIELERKIDEMIFDLYGLTQEERKIVLQATS